MDEYFTCGLCGKRKLITDFGVISDWGDCCYECLREALRSHFIKINFHKKLRKGKINFHKNLRKGVFVDA